MNRKSVVAFFLAALASGGAVADEATVDFSKYMQYSPAISAISSAVDAASGCSVPLVFDEVKEEGALILGVHCRGNEDDEISIFIRFMDDGYSILPLKFDYAG